MKHFSIFAFILFIFTPKMAHACVSDGFLSIEYIVGLFLGILFSIILIGINWKKRSIWKDNGNKIEKIILAFQVIAALGFLGSSIYIDESKIPPVIVTFVLFSFLNILFAALYGVKSVRSKKAKESVRRVFFYLLIAAISYMIASIIEAMAYSLC